MRNGSTAVNPPTDRIVVGVDGSPASRTALRWALGEAEVRGAEVVAVRAWRPIGDLLAPYAPVPSGSSPDREREDAETDLADTVAEVAGPSPPVKVHQLVVRERPVPALLDQATEADLLVLGGHRSASPHGHALGAVAAACLRRSSCPVVIVARHR